MKRELAGMALLLSVAACASSPPAATPTKPADPRPPRPLDNYVRVSFMDDRDAGKGYVVFQTSARTFSRPDRGTVVVLLSMTHVAQGSYYRGLEAHLRDAEIVLAESTGGQPPGKPLPDDQLPEEGLWSRRMDLAIARLLGLVRQSEWEQRIVDDRWVLADMNTEEIAKIMRAKGVTFLGAEGKANVEKLEALLAGNADANELARERAALEEQLMASAYHYEHPEGAERDLHDMREEVMWRIIRERLDTVGRKRVALVYGAWHSPYLEEKLVRELGFRVDATCWHDAVTSAQDVEITVER